MFSAKAETKKRQKWCEHTRNTHEIARCPVFSVRRAKMIGYAMCFLWSFEQLYSSIQSIGGNAHTEWTLCREQQKKRTCVHAYIRIKLCIQFLHCVLKHKRNINTYRIWTPHIIFLHASKCEKLCMRMYKFQIHFRLAIFFLISIQFCFPLPPPLPLTLYSIVCFSIFLFVSFVLSFPNFMRYFFHACSISLPLACSVQLCERVCVCAFGTRSLLADLLHHTYKIWAEQNCTRKHTRNRALIQSTYIDVFVHA